MVFQNAPESGLVQAIMASMVLGNILHGYKIVNWVLPSSWLLQNWCTLNIHFDLYQLLVLLRCSSLYPGMVVVSLYDSLSHDIKLKQKWYRRRAYLGNMINKFPAYNSHTRLAVFFFFVFLPCYTWNLYHIEVKKQVMLRYKTSSL